MGPRRVPSEGEDLRLLLSPVAVTGAFTEWDGWENSPGVLKSGFPGKCDCFIYQMKTHSQDLLKVTVGELAKSGIEHVSVCLFYPTWDPALGLAKIKTKPRSAAVFWASSGPGGVASTTVGGVLLNCGEGEPLEWMRKTSHAQHLHLPLVGASICSLSLVLSVSPLSPSVSSWAPSLHHSFTHMHICAHTCLCHAVPASHLCPDASSTRVTAPQSSDSSRA